MLKLFRVNLFVIISLTFAKATENVHQEFNLQDYQHSLQGRKLAYEFFDFLRNSSELTRNEEATDLSGSQCATHLSELTNGIFKANLWALRFLDSWGSIPTGLLYGNFYDLGNFDECIRIQKDVTNMISIKGKYCTATLPLGKLFGAMSILSIKTATCLPAACSADDINNLFKQFLRVTFNLNIAGDIKIIEESGCSVQEAEPLSGVAIAVICILSIMGALIALSTLYDYFAGSAKKKLPALINAFSLRTNARQLFRLVDYSKNPNVIPCLNGIRCLSLVWVILGHCFSFYFNNANLNMLDIYKWLQTPFSMLITQGFFSVDSFFFLSALLLSMIFLREMDKRSGKVNIPLMYLHRYLRLTPIVGFAILVYLSMKYVGDGPFWETLGWRTWINCEKNWWLTLLYVQNYVKAHEMCFGFTWYLAVDMQLYILSPILLIAIWKWGKRAVLATIILLLLLWACLFTTIMINDYSLFYKRLVMADDSMRYIYYPTHMRSSPWIIGLLFGYYLHKIKGQKLEMPAYQVLLGWIISLGLIATSIFSLYAKGQIPAAAPLTTLEEAFFISLTRIAWPLALCWIVFACIQGYAGPVNSFLSSPLWQPLARLSYCMYIFHGFILCINTARMRTNTYFSSYDVMLRFWSDFGFTLLLSVAVYLLIEAPLSGLQQTLFAAKRQTTKPTTTTIPKTTATVSEKLEQSTLETKDTKEDVRV